MNKTKRITLPLCRCLALLVMLLGVSVTAKAQITELKDENTAKVHLYLRFTEQAQVRKVAVKYTINGQSYSTSDYNDVTVGSNTFFDFIIEAPYDATNKCLQNPIEIERKGISWRDGVISFTKYNENTAKFYGDAFIFMEEQRGALEVNRVDNALINEVMEESVMYAFDPSTRLSTRLNNDDDGQCIWEVNTQDFQHVANKNRDMSTYPYFSEIILVRKSAYKSWQYTLNNDTYGDLQQTFGSTADLQGNDVFHACADGSSKDNAATLFNTLREVEEQDWPTSCTATRSCAVQSYASAQNDFGGLVGHFRLTLKPRVKKWKAESWVQLDNPYHDGWATFCTPYDVQVPAGLLVLIIDKMVPGKADRLNMESMADYYNIPAGTGVVVKGYGTFEFHPTPSGDATIAGDRTAYSTSGNLMQYVPLTGINSVPYSCGEGNHYVLTLGTETLTKDIKDPITGDIIETLTETIKVPKFVPATENSPKLSDGWDDTASAGHIPPFKSFLCISGVGSGGGGGVHELNVNWDDIADAIGGVPLAPNKTTAIYDLAGRKVTNGKMPHGIYIINGKKRVVK